MLTQWTTFNRNYRIIHSSGARCTDLSVATCTRILLKYKFLYRFSEIRQQTEFITFRSRVLDRVYSVPDLDTKNVRTKSVRIRGKNSYKSVRILVRKKFKRYGFLRKSSIAPLISLYVPTITMDEDVLVMRGRREIRIPKIGVK